MNFNTENAGKRNKIVKVRRERHQGKREMARRLQQRDTRVSRIAGYIALPNGTYKTVWDDGQTDNS
jgi:hypothetical protein